MQESAPEPMAEAVISLDNLRHNARLLKEKAGVPLMAVVKANAYGHGAAEVAGALAGEGVRHFGVANIQEAADLRQAGTIKSNSRILAFSSPLPSQIGHYLRNDIEMTLCSAESLRAAEETAAGTGSTLGVHLKVDTGMGRLGLPPEEASALLRELERCPHVELRGLYTHFADSSGERAFTRRQLETFKTFAAEYEHSTGRRVVKHAANSGAILTEPEASLDMVRPGILLYGAMPSRGITDTPGVRPVMRLEGRVVFLKTVEKGTTVSYGRTWSAPTRRRIATLAAGYADGYHRTLSGKGTVTINGTPYPQIGTVTMDQIMVDLGEESEVRVGDRAVLFGEGGISVDQLAERAGTIGYELLCAVSARVRRVFR